MPNHIASECWYRYDHSYQAEQLSEALAAFTTNDNKDPIFYVDSGATSHMTNDIGRLSYIKPYHGNDVAFVGDGYGLPISHTGEFDLNVLVVPDLKKNLLSIGKLAIDNMCTLEFTESDFVVKDQNQKAVARERKKGHLYALDDFSQEVFAAIRKRGSSADYGTCDLGIQIRKFYPS